MLKVGCERAQIFSFFFFYVNKHACTKFRASFDRRRRSLRGRGRAGARRGVRAASAAAEPGPLVLPPLATLAAHGHGKASLPCGGSTAQTARRARSKGRSVLQIQVSSARCLRSQRRLFCALVCAAAGAPSRGDAVPRRASASARARDAGCAVARARERRLGSRRRAPSPRVLLRLAAAAAGALLRLTAAAAGVELPAKTLEAHARARGCFWPGTQEQLVDSEVRQEACECASAGEGR
jgi:hypothetical protein